MHRIDDAMLAAESAVSDFDELADEAYGEPEDPAFAAVGGVHDDHAERELRRILARVFGM